MANLKYHGYVPMQGTGHLDKVLYLEYKDAKDYEFALQCLLLHLMGMSPANTPVGAIKDKVKAAHAEMEEVRRHPHYRQRRPHWLHVFTVESEN